ncbi:hypothetical protein PT974_04400 [Cladobotryum mycophilum]|uniref:C2H2-type domain-containing protein n=1 Tax=Cladobotryum mycophilum TaxID=491253 RepID=A0ABR0SUW2_9HYPO
MEIADFVEPHVAGLPPLPKNRDRETIPWEYDVPSSVRENEGAAPFVCPQLGCDGLAFETAGECHRHEDEYHSPPYWCGECDASFAAESALRRHLSASGHRVWICEEKGCDMEGIQFSSKDGYVAHALESMNHRAIDLRRQTAVVRRRVSPDSDDMMEDVLSDCPSDVGEMCTQPCCHKFEHPFPSRGEWDRHAISHGHVSAVRLSETLAALDLPAEQLAARQASARGFTCDAPGCQHFGRRLSTSQSYYRHVEAAGHREPRPRIERAALKPIVKEAMRVRMVCEEVACGKFGQEFGKAGSWFRHVAGVGHVRAARFGEVMRRMERGLAVDVGVQQQQQFGWSGQQQCGLDGQQQYGFGGGQQQQQPGWNGVQQQYGLDGGGQQQQQQSPGVGQEFQAMPATPGYAGQEFGDGFRTVPVTPGQGGQQSFGDVFPLSPEGSGMETMVYATPTKQQMSMHMPLTPTSPLKSSPSWREEVLQQRNMELEGQVQRLRMELSQMKVENEQRMEAFLGKLDGREWDAGLRGDI